jgi:hypothetical protein
MPRSPHGWPAAVLLSGAVAAPLAAAQGAAVLSVAEAGVERASLFEMTAGDRLEDAGVFVVRSARMGRTESFEVLRRPDGSRVVTSVTRGADDGYRVEGRWTYGPREIATGAIGRAVIDGRPSTIVIELAGGRADIRIDDGAEQRRYAASCAAGCLVDLAPSALPMFTMTRRYDAAAGGPQSFRWIGHSLTEAQVLLDGMAEIEKLGDADFVAADGTRLRVQQFAFVETLRDEASGRSIRVAFNLYVDETHRPLAFAIGSSTVGERVGVEGLTATIPVRMPATR